MTKRIGFHVRITRPTQKKKLLEEIPRSSCLVEQANCEVAEERLWDNFVPTLKVITT